MRGLKKWTEPDAEELKNKELSPKERCMWRFFINKNGDIEFNPMCENCDGECKQSFRAKLIYCETIAKKKNLK